MADLRFWHPLRTRSLASNPFILYARDRSSLDADPVPYSPACCRDSIVFEPQWLTTGRNGFTSNHHCPIQQLFTGEHSLASFRGERHPRSFAELGSLETINGCTP